MAGGTAVSGDETKRLASLAVPPAYEDVFYAADPSAHLQAVGRETRKARRLARLAEVLPQIRRSIGRHLGLNEPTRALRAVRDYRACRA